VANSRRDEAGDRVAADPFRQEMDAPVRATNPLRVGDRIARPTLSLLHTRRHAGALVIGAVLVPGMCTVGSTLRILAFVGEHRFRRDARVRDVPAVRGATDRESLRTPILPAMVRR
jgi:hypothetical protein